jgi:hypothetical protein
MRIWALLASFVMSLVLIGTSQAQNAGSWDGSWTGAWGGRSQTEIRISGPTVQYFYQGRPLAVNAVQKSPDRLSFEVGFGGTIVLRRAGPGTAHASFQSGSSQGHATLTRSAIRAQTHAEGWSGTWTGVADHTRVPFRVSISGNQATDYSYGRERSEVISSAASGGTITINVRSYRGDAIVTLQRDGSNSALYQFTVPRAGIRVTGRALRQ